MPKINFKNVGFETPSLFCQPESVDASKTLQSADHLGLGAGLRRGNHLLTPCVAIPNPEIALIWRKILACPFG